LLLSENRLDGRRGVIDTAETLIHPDGRRESSSFAVRMYTLADLAGMCRTAGLRITAAYGDFAGAEYGLDTQRLILTARKESEPST